MHFRRIGILGGGQLAQMLCEAARSAWDMSVSVFSDVADCPAATATTDLVVGKMTVEDLSKFINEVEIVLFESEFIDADLLKGVQIRLAEGNVGEPHEFEFCPSLDTMSRLQDKLLQKKLCETAQCPTARWEVVDPKLDINGQIENFEQLFPEGAVLKWSRNGYDGKGNFFVSDWSAQREDITNFIAEGHNKLAVTYAEEKIQFRKELAVVCIRTREGKISSYPVVVSEQQKGTCLNVFGPADRFGIEDSLASQVLTIARKIGETSGIIGAYGVELFLTKENKLLVNEIAPRVHNTGHYTQDCAETSQFENHLRAALELPLGSCKHTGAFFGMRNILGPQGIQVEDCPQPKASEGSILHWYHKKGCRPGRKLGHINVLSDSEDEFNKKWQGALNDEQSWIKTIKK